MGSCLSKFRKELLWLMKQYKQCANILLKTHFAEEVSGKRLPLYLPPRATTMFNSRSASRTVQERIRCGFGRLSRAAVHMEDPYAYGWEHDDPFSPILISQNSEVTVCSGITMDEALLGQSSMDEQVNEELHSAYADQSNHLDMAFGREAMTTPHNIQKERVKPVSVRHLIPDDEGEGERGELIEETKRRVNAARTESTVESSEEDDVLELWPVTSESDEDMAVDTPPSSLPVESKRNVSVVLEDFDFDHLTIYQDSVFDNDEESNENNEAWLAKKLERNASELYWLQLSTKLTDPKRLILAMQGNTAVRNVTVYPCVLQNLSKLDQKLLVDSICQMESLQNLIVFQDCGSLFVEPLIRYRPPLTRLTLYKVGFAGDMLLSRLAVLLLGLPLLEELSLEKYRGADGTKLLNMFSKVLPSLSNLRSLTLTPARGVKMSTEGPRTLFKALWGNTTVRTLSLQGSEDSIDEECMKELHLTLKANTKLAEVKLTGFWKVEEEFWSRFDGKTTAQIRYYLQLNKSGIRSLHLDVNADYETLRSSVLRYQNNVDFMFYLLLHNPSMVNGKIPEARG